MSYLEELLPEFRKGAKIRLNSWEKGRYLYFKDGKIYNSKNGITSICVDSLGMESSWELYQEPINWDYIIKNKCLCWFWDSKEYSMRSSCLKNVRYYDKDTVQYIDTNDTYWLNCRPVRRDEITFYEDKTNED